MNERILRLKRAVEDSQESTIAARKRAVARKETRKSSREGCDGLPAEDFRLPSGDWDRKRFTVLDVEQWFHDETKEVFGEGMPLSVWRLKEKRLAKMLLDEYGPAVLQGVVLWIFRNWDGLVEKSRGRLLGIPTIEILWCRRSIYISEMTKEDMGYSSDPLQSSKNADEFKNSKETPDVGW